jgi:phage N-6-adenine-methyltransferase
LRIR